MADLHIVHYQADCFEDAAYLIADISLSVRDESVFNASDYEFLVKAAVSPARREEWLWGRYVLKRLLQMKYEFDPASVHVGAVESRPKLILPEGTMVKLSLAHKDRYVMAGVSTKAQIGVDIEISENAPNAERVLKRIASDEEIAAAASHASLCERDYFLLLWCLKESCVKAGLVDSVFELKRHILKILDEEKNTDVIFYRAELQGFNLAYARALLRRDFYASVILS
jgi:4'-phosphopantetheinyl transferase EntD